MDESLNIVLRSAAERANQNEFNVFRIFMLIAQLGISKRIFAPRCDGAQSGQGERADIPPGRRVERAEHDP